MLIMYFEENQIINMIIKMLKHKKLSPWKWFLILWLSSLGITAFVAYSLKWFLKWMS